MAHVEAVDVFCGAGGLSLGLRAAGIPLSLREWSGTRTLLAHGQISTPAALVHQGDVRQVDWRRFDGVALVVGGPPCQPWSIGGLRQGRAT